MDDDTHTEVLRRNLTHLLSNIDDPISLTDHLYSASNQFTVCNKERVECKKTRVDRNRELITTLQRKDRELYEYFLIALEKTGHNYLIRGLKCDGVLVCLEKVLKSQYIETTSKIVYLKAIHSHFEHENKDYITDEDVIGLVLKLFRRVDFDSNARRFINLANKPTLQIVLNEEAYEESCSYEMAGCELNKGTLCISTWDEERVCNWLKDIGILPNIANEFKTQMINGEALLELSEQDLKDEFPDLKLGQRKILLKRRKYLMNNAETTLSYEVNSTKNVDNESRCDVKLKEDLDIVSQKVTEKRELFGENAQSNFHCADVQKSVDGANFQETTANLSLDLKTEIGTSSFCGEQNLGTAEHVSGETSSLPISDISQDKSVKPIIPHQKESKVTGKVSTKLLSEESKNGSSHRCTDNGAFSREKDAIQKVPLQLSIIEETSKHLFNTGSRLDQKDDALSKGSKYRWIDDGKLFFSEVNLLSKDWELQLQREFVRFTCACLTDRLIGRFVIGVDNDFSVVGQTLNNPQKSYVDAVYTGIKKSFGEYASVVEKFVCAPIFRVVLPCDDHQFVCEIDFVPDKGLCGNNMFFAKLPKEGNKKGKKIIFRFCGETIKTLIKGELEEYCNSVTASHGLTDKVLSLQINKASHEMTEKHIVRKPEKKEAIMKDLQENISKSDISLKVNNDKELQENLTKPNVHIKIEDVGSRSPNLRNSSKVKENKIENLKSYSKDATSPSTGDNGHSYTPAGPEKTPEPNDSAEPIQAEEIPLSPKRNESMMNKLATLLCLGDEMTINDLYPILVINSPSVGESLEEYAFIGNIPWKLVYDFGGNEDLVRLFERSSKVDTKVIPTAQYFDPKNPQYMVNPEKFKSLQDDIETSMNTHFSQIYTGPHWVYANGGVDGNYPHLDVQMWNRVQRPGFKESVSLYDNLIPRGRAVLVFLALSNDIILVEAMTELISTFQDQWVFIANDTVAQPIKDELLRRNFITESTLEERAIVGLDWKSVNDICNRIYCKQVVDTCKLCCTANGNFITVNQKWKNSLYDLEIISANEYEDIEFKESQTILEQEELKYYNGAEVSWLNFKAKTHVCERDTLNDLKQFVKDALNPSSIDETYVGKVLLYHQPGAGGTTVARNILWDLKDKYRCAVVKSISDQTVNQIKEFRSFQDHTPKPVLLLMDNLDEEPANVLVAQLEEKSKQIVRWEENNDGNTPVCVFLVCWRKSQLPTATRLSSYNQAYRCSLGHNLSPKENKWWSKKYKELEHRDQASQELGESRVHPKLLISFNIMKSNFDKDVIRKMTTHLVTKIEDPKERKLLKFVALLNAYDVNFRSIPSSSFDIMMMDFCINNAKKKKKNSTKSEGVLFFLSGGPSGIFRDNSSQICSWISKLSLEFRLLMNDPSPFTKRSITNLRITNPLLSQEVLEVLRSLEGYSQSISAMAMEFLDCNEIFNVRGIARTRIVQTVVDIMKRRERAPSGKPETYFAPLLQYIVEKEDVERASKVMEKVFEISQDAFIAQHIARINIYSQNWEKAIQFSRKATTILPENSILWDTCGRIYQRKLAEQYKILSTSHHVNMQSVVELIGIAYTGINHFYKAQEISEKEQIGFQNNVGFLGQLEITQLLFLCLGKAPCFHQKDLLTKFLLDDKNAPKEIQEVLSQNEDTETLGLLREIIHGVEKAIGKLEDERMQLKEPMFIDEYRSKSDLVNHERLDEIKANLYDFLREKEIALPENISPKEACIIRSRQIRVLGGNSFWSILDLMAQTDGEGRLCKIKELCLENLETASASAEDFETIIEVCLALAQFPKHMNDIDYSDLANWSKTLYRKRDTIRGGKIHLEPYLFYVMFNWPRNNNESHFIPKVELQDTLEKWKKAYFGKYPKQRNSERKAVAKEGTTVYFFARGNEMASIVKARELRRSVGPGAKGETFWKEPSILQTLQRFSGVLRNEGEEVDITLAYPSGDKAVITIPTSLPKKDRRLWHKEVFFVIGFTWIGPKAFDVRRENPVNHLNAPCEMPVVKEMRKFSKRKTYNSLLDQQSRTEAKLKSLQTRQKQRKLSAAEEKELKQLRRTIESIEEQTRNIMERLDEF